jgi:sugar O-acyltransferase (sialic acid O-acetyltransferase NeuD family)
VAVNLPAVQRLAIIGAGGHGREVLDVVEALNQVEPRFEVVGVVADQADADLLARRRVQLLGTVDQLVDGLLHDDVDQDKGPLALVLAIGDPVTRAVLAQRVEAVAAARSLQWAPALVHPAATVGGDVELGSGVVVAAGGRITTNVRVGQHVQVNVNAVVSHDCRLGDHVTLSPGVLVNGTVTIGPGSFLGTGAIVTPGRSIGAGVVVGAGAVVVDDVPPGVIAKGVPARWAT